MDLLISLVRCRQNAIHQTFHRALDSSQRRAKLMADIADQTTSHRLSLVKFLSHLIETHRKLCEFIFTIYLHTFIVTPLCNPLCSKRHGLHGCNYAAAEKQTKDYSDKHCCEGGVRQHFIETGTEINKEFRHRAITIHPHTCTCPRCKCHSTVSHSSHVMVEGCGQNELARKDQYNHAHHNNGKIRQE